MTKRILYFLTPGENISPFDVTMAADSGFDMVVPLLKVELKNVTAIIQDAIFCRPPKRFNDTGIFIGGRDIHLAADMFENAKNAMVGPFQVGVFADPNGAYTTSGSIVALVDQALKKHHGLGLAGRTVAVFGTGPVGICTAVLAAKQGAKVKLCQLLADDDKRYAETFFDRYDVNVEYCPTLTNQQKTDSVENTEVIVCAARAGIRILEGSLNNAKKLLVVADSNAVPPSGVIGVGLNDAGNEVEYKNGTFRSIGPMTIGNLKYKTQFRLFGQLQTSEKVSFIDFSDAYNHALSLLDN